jgi:hypothetical protein
MFLGKTRLQALQQKRFPEEVEQYELISELAAVLPRSAQEYYKNDDPIKPVAKHVDKPM